MCALFMHTPALLTLVAASVAVPETDPRLQNWHLINLFSVDKYSE
jgi:hypothetical protein